jgi:hypothetical protein
MSESRCDRSLAIAYAHGRDVGEVDVFVKTLRNHSECTIVLMTDVTSPETERFFEKYDVTQIPSRWRSYVMPPSYGTLMNARFLELRGLLKLQFHKYHSILISDCRDVLFQGNPFMALQSDELYFAPEDPLVKLSDSDNLFGLKGLVGREIEESIRDMNTVCAGTLLGTARRIADYLELFYSIYSKFETLSGSKIDFPIDQGILNLICYIPDLAKQVRGKVLNHTDPIATVGMTISLNPEQIRVGTAGIIYNGKLPLVVHQYDRSQSLKSYAQELSKYL